MGGSSSKSNSKKEGSSAVCGGFTTKDKSSSRPSMSGQLVVGTLSTPGANQLRDSVVPVLVQPILEGGVKANLNDFSTSRSPYANVSEEEVRAVGLDNFGNTCYCNSVVQLLYHCSALRTRLLSLYEDFFTKKPPNDTVLYRLSDLIHQMHISKKTMRRDEPACAKLQSFVKRYKVANELFDNRHQHDAHEFAIFILNTIIDDEKDLLSIPKSKRGPIQDIFEGQLRTSTYCLECETKADRKQPFLDINLQIQSHASITHSFSSFMAPEFFSADNKFYCEACCSHVCAKQMHTMDKAPRDAMIVHLKRFEFSEKDQSLKKLSYHVPVPDVIGLETKSGSSSSSVEEGSLSIFRLKGFVVHQGAGVNVGHYVGCFRTLEEWRRYDDELVTALPERDLQQYYGEPKVDDSMLTVAMTAYILLYERQY